MDILIRASGKHKRQGENRGAYLEFALALVLCAAPAVSTRAQVPLTPHDTEEANQLFDSGPRSDRLRCTIEPQKPFLDFALRFDASYIVRCPLREFEGKETIMLIFVRVTPEGGAPVVLGGAYKMRGTPRDVFARTDLGKLKSEVSASGAFSVGEGRYLAEVLVLDTRSSRICQRRWRIKIARNHQQRAVPVAIAAHTVLPMQIRLWDGKLLGTGTGVRLTLLLDAAPINPYQLKLRAWDQALLLGVLSSVLQQTPCESVRLVAFNLDQQREILRQDRFDPSGFEKLRQAFHDLELGAVSAGTLEQHQGWAELLAGLTNHEVTAAEPSDAVVFLGPRARIAKKIPREMLKARETSKPQFFYLEYFPHWLSGSEFPDAIDYLTKAREGTILKIHNTTELAQAIQKMLKQLQQSDRETTRSR